MSDAAITHVQPFRLTSNEILKQYNKNWSYTGKFININRYALSAILSQRDQIGLVQKTVNRGYLVVNSLKIFSIMGTAAVVSFIALQVKKVKASIRRKDVAGTIFSSLELSSTITGSCGYYANWTNALLVVLSRPGINLLYRLESPLGLVSIGLNTTTMVMQLKEHLAISSRLKKLTMPSSDNLETLKLSLSEFLDSHLGTYDLCNSEHEKNEHLSDEVFIIKRKLEQNFNRKSIELIRSIVSLLRAEEMTQEDMHTVLNKFKTIRKELQKEIGNTIFYLFVNGLDAIAITLFFFPITNLFSFLMLAVSALLRLSMHIFNSSRS